MLEEEESRQDADGVCGRAKHLLLLSLTGPPACLYGLQQFKGPPLVRQASVPQKEGSGCPPPFFWEPDAESTQDLYICPSSASLSKKLPSVSSDTYAAPALRLAQRADMTAGFTVRVGVRRRGYLAGNKMNRNNRTK